MLVTAFWQAHICTWRTLYLASFQYSVSLKNNYDLCSYKDGARKAVNRSRQNLKFYSATHSTWKVHSLCIHMTWMSNTSSFQMLWMMILKHSRLKSSFRGPRVCLVDCDPLNVFLGATLVCPGATNPSALWLLGWCVQIETLQELQYAFTLFHRGRSQNIPVLSSPSLLLPSVVFCL